jgi:hypothetical protein
MRKLKTVGLALLGAFALGAMAWADGPTKGDSGTQAEQSPSWIARFFADDDQGPPWRVKAKRQKDRLEKERLESESAQKAVQKPTDRNRTEAKKANEPDAKEAGRHDQEMAAIKREQADYLRRLAVCDQLREIALKNNDENLNRQADDLQAQAWAVYSKHVASVAPGKGSTESQGEASKINAKPEGQGSSSRKVSHADVSYPVDSEPRDTEAKEEKP